MRGAGLAAILLLMGSPVAGAEDTPARWVTVDGNRIRYLASGPEGGPVLLMVHGWAGSAEDFRPLFALLPAGTRAVAVDLPGCGFSDKPDAAYDLPYFLDFLHHFCAALGLERFTLLGHSLGGLFAVHFATLWPGMVERLILAAPYGLPGEEGSILFLSREVHEGVNQQVEENAADARLVMNIVAGNEAEQHVANVRDRRIREQALQVVLRDCGQIPGRQRRKRDEDQ